MLSVPTAARLCAAALALTVVATAAAPLAAHAAPGRPPLRCEAGQGYAVETGDSWYALARGAGVGVDALLTANGATAETVLLPGDEICLPTGTAPPASWSSRACGGGTAYTVATGDSWFGIAARAGVTGSAVLAANAADSSRVLHPGETICLPAGANVAASATGATGSSGRTAVALDALPLQGPCWFGDTWGAPRANGRRHQGVDLVTWTGRYVYAVTDGVLTRRAWDQPGSRSGNAWWLTSADGSNTYYFYAHLSDFAPGLQVGSRVTAGQIIGFVGSTGSSSTPHLHFEIHPGGTGSSPALNPYATLRGACG
jgi:murein DD-endopeptidase MepM/ murein hydrolase activator NlpD